MDTTRVVLTLFGAFVFIAVGYLLAFVRYKLGWRWGYRDGWRFGMSEHAKTAGVRPQPQTPVYSTRSRRPEPFINRHRV